MKWLDHHLNGHESEQTPGAKGTQRGLACFSPWGRKKQTQVTEQAVLSLGNPSIVNSSHLMETTFQLS